MDYTEKPDNAAVIDICTAASLRELATPALLAVLTPAIVGFGISYLALGAFLAAVILTGQLMAVFLSNSGGAWDNAKKYIEDGHEGGKGSDAHKAAVIGDTVGDPFKDTAGPALNPLIKVMNLVSLLLLPVVISMRNNTAGRFTIAAVCLVILIVAVAFSKRSTGALAEEVPTVPFESSGETHSPDDLLRADVAAGAHGLNRPDGPEGDLIVAIDLVIDRFGDDEVLIERLRARRAHFEEPEGV
jgi:K(+)-stimulated pyrophosphate-energized sodium pump